MIAEPCGEPWCSSPAIGIWAWKAIDMTVGVAYCAEHVAIIRAKVETAGRMAGGATIQELRN